MYFEIKKDKNGETYASFIGAESEHIAGWISDKLPNGEPNAYLANIDGKQWVCVKEAFLPAYYNKEFIDELENALDCHVDVVTTGIEDKKFLSKIMQEGVLLYEE